MYSAPVVSLLELVAAASKTKVADTIQYNTIQYKTCNAPYVTRMLFVGAFVGAESDDEAADAEAAETASPAFFRRVVQLFCKAKFHFASRSAD